MTAPPTTDSSAFRRALDGQYAVDRELGRGGMGIVYLARDLKLDRLVAVKTLPPQLAGDATLRERFLREARTAAALSHPSIVPIHRADEMDGQVFFVMGYVDGESMAQRIRARGALAPREVIAQLRDVALALDYAHSRGVVHRDIKAENILLDEATGRAHVTDFGIARLAEASPLTQTGQVLGTVYYLSPEQVTGERVDGRSDLYALGVVGYLALSGRFPFDAELASAVLVAHVTRPAPALASVNAAVPSALAAIIDRCLVKDPAHRYQSGAELAAALSAIEREVATAPAAVVTPTTSLLSDTEAQAIWARASELQAHTGVQPRPAPVAVARNAARDQAVTSGYNIPDVRAAALEAGIDERYVDHALVEHGLGGNALARGGSTPVAVGVRDKSSGEMSLLTGGPTQLDYEVVVEGEMPERDFDLLADIIRLHTDDVGNYAAVGRSLAWRSSRDRRRIQVSVLPRGGKTSIRVNESMGELAGRTFGPMMGVGAGPLGVAAFGSLMASGHHALAPIAWGTTAIGAYVAARLTFRRMAGRRRKTLRELIDALAQQARDSIAAGQPKLLR